MKNKAIQWLAVLLVAIMLFLPFSFLLYSKIKLSKYTDIVYECSRLYSIEPCLIYAVIKAESNFSERATSSRGAKGLMQIMDETFVYVCKLYGLKHEIGRIYEPSVNVEVGVAYLNYLTKKFVTEREILSAYNAGEGKISEWLRDERYSNDGARLRYIPFEETSKYCEKVIRYKEIYGVILK